MNLAELKEFAPAAKPVLLEGLLAAWSFAEARGITTPNRICHFMAQCFVESGGFRVAEEARNYTAKRLVQVWPKRFPTIQAATPYANNPKALANKSMAAGWGIQSPMMAGSTAAGGSSRSRTKTIIGPAAVR
jgi:putative chitinase